MSHLGASWKHGWMIYIVAMRGNGIGQLGGHSCWNNWYLTDHAQMIIKVIMDCGQPWLSYHSSNLGYDIGVAWYSERCHEKYSIGARVLIVTKWLTQTWLNSRPWFIFWYLKDTLTYNMLLYSLQLFVHQTKIWVKHCL